MMDCFVYLICHEGRRQPVKVGISRSVEGRLGSLQTGNPHKLEVIFTFWTPDFHLAKEVESTFHENNADSRMSGEWFALEPDMALAKLVGCFAAILQRDLGHDQAALEAALSASGATEAAALVRPKRGLH